MLECLQSLLDENSSGCGHTNLAMSAIKELRAEPVFEIPDLFAQRRLRDPQPLRGAGEMELLGNGNDITKNS
jgi:hypothetical protein